MRQRAIAFAGILFIAQIGFAQQRQQGQGQQVPTFTTNGNGGIVDAPPQGQRGGGQRGPARPAGPAPRDANGRAMLVQPPGQPGLWIGGITNLTNADGTPLRPPYQPWTQGVALDRRQNQLEPHTRCKPSGGPRQFLTPYGVEFVELPELKRMYIFDIGGPHTFRIIYMDGRQHPKDYVPDYYGHNVGHWEGDTLVIDSVGYNEKFWIDRGTYPHTEKLHMIERLTRVDANTIKYEVTIDDPGAYTAPFTGQFSLRYTAGDELFEYVCQDNNFASSLMIGVLESVDRTSTIIP